MGRISAIYCRDGALAASERHAATPLGLRRDGTLAGVDGRHHNRAGDLSLPPAVQSDCQRHLSQLLGSLHEQPEDLAARLLYRFGSIARISQASEIELRQAAQKGESWVGAFVAIRQLVHDGLREKLVRTRLGDNQGALTAYLLATMQNLDEERMLAIFADAAGHIIAEEVIAEGSCGDVLVTPRKLFGRALSLNARRILLAHNHPSGCSRPSNRDVEHTRLLSKQANDLGLAIDDHLIIGYRSVTSMRNRGFI